MEEKVKIICLRLSVYLLDKIDKYVRNLGYKSRSEFVRKAVENYMSFIDGSGEGGLTIGLNVEDLRRLEDVRKITGESIPEIVSDSIRQYSMKVVKDEAEYKGYREELGLV